MIAISRTRAVLILLARPMDRATIGQMTILMKMKMMTTKKRRLPARLTATMAVPGETAEEAAGEAVAEEAVMVEAVMEEAAMEEAAVQLPPKPTGILTLRTTVSTATTPVKPIPMTE
jgi:hypothetical protein